MDVAVRYFQGGRESRRYCKHKTDNSGVFFTSLESEYAVMARALETIVDQDGNPRFYKREVYDWLDQVRRMGNKQGFASTPPE